MKPIFRPPHATAPTAPVPATPNAGDTREMAAQSLLALQATGVALNDAAASLLDVFGSSDVVWGVLHADAAPWFARMDALWYIICHHTGRFPDLDDLRGVMADCGVHPYNLERNICTESELSDTRRALLMGALVGWEFRSDGTITYPLSRMAATCPHWRGDMEISNRKPGVDYANQGASNNGNNIAVFDPEELADLPSGFEIHGDLILETDMLGSDWPQGLIVHGRIFLPPNGGVVVPGWVNAVSGVHDYVFSYDNPF